VHPELDAVQLRVMLAGDSSECAIPRPEVIKVELARPDHLLAARLSLCSTCQRSAR